MKVKQMLTYLEYYSTSRVFEKNTDMLMTFLIRMAAFIATVSLAVLIGMTSLQKLCVRGGTLLFTRRRFPFSFSFFPPVDHVQLRAYEIW